MLRKSLKTAFKSFPPIKRRYDYLSALTAEKIGLQEGLDESLEINLGLRKDLERINMMLEKLHAETKKYVLATFTITTDYTYNPKNRSNISGSRTPKATEAINDIVCRGCATYIDLLTSTLKYSEGLAKIDSEGDPDDIEPYWNNGWLPSLDAMSLYTLVVRNNPATYLEVGSGNSTKFVRRAIKDHGLRTRIVSIDPYPRASIDSICDEIIRQPFEDVNTSFYGSLVAGDMVFIDNSHRSFQNSDVTVFFTEMMPLLPKGIIFGIHDIFLPYDYPAEWCERFYNEQYLLQTYLLGGAGPDEIIWPSNFLALDKSDPEIVATLDAIFSHETLKDVPRIGGCFWLHRTAS